MPGGFAFHIAGNRRMSHNGRERGGTVPPHRKDSMTNDQPSEPHTIAGMANIVFTDPPPVIRRGHSIHPWENIAAQLRERPGEWALVLRGIHSSYATQIRRGKLAAFRPEGAFEALSVKSTVTNDGKPTNDLYIKFVGHEKAQPQANDN